MGTEFILAPAAFLTGLPGSVPAERSEAVYSLSQEQESRKGSFVTRL